jgi:hypothetical protein
MCAYQIAGVIPGRYHVEFSSGCGATGYRIQWYHGAASRAGSAPVTVTAGTTTPGIDAS